MSGVIYLIASPIGNLKDISFRAIETLNKVNYIFAEDTRVSKKLLSYYKISKKLYSLHKYNELNNLEDLLKIIYNNFDIAILSDAGTPAIADPGSFIVNHALKNNIKVIPIPGPSALSSAISCSGFINNNRILFLGFLPHKKTQKEKLFLELLNTNIDSIVFFEAANRIKNTLLTLKNIFINCEIVILRELTKVFEEVKLLKNQDCLVEKGEYTVSVKLNNNFVILKDNAKLSASLAKYLNIKTKEAYKIILDLKNKEKNA